MKKEKRKEKESSQSGVSRRNFCKVVAGISLGGTWSTMAIFASAEDVPEEPENLDEATPWQEGDPDPIEKQVPAVEPEQTSAEAPPSQPMDDERPEQPGLEYVWVAGYWWWTRGTYMWVPGYWALPPHTGYVYVSGYWTYRGSQWIYVRGGWAKSNTTAIVVYPRPRPLLAAFVFAAPIRIVRRNHRWRHYHARRAHHSTVRRRHNRRVKRTIARPVRPGRPARRPGRPRKPFIK